MSNPTFIPHIHAFRGIAIVTIVAAHAWSFPIFWTGTLDSPALARLFHFMETLFHGSTIYFALISGLLYSLVLTNKSWPAFFRGKLLNVLAPFCLLTLLISCLNWQYALEQGPADWSPIAKFIYSFAQNLVFGQAMIHFWYIPVLLVLFIATPVLWRIQKTHIGLSVIIVLLPLVISRSPFPDFLKVQSFVYFLGAYNLGLLMGSHYDRVKSYIKRFLPSILLLTLFCSVLIYCLFYWGYQAEGFYSLIQTAIYLQKIGISLLLLYWLSQPERSLPDWLMSLGTFSFSIYFLHVLVMWPYILSFSTVLTENRSSLNIFFIGLLNLVVAVLASMMAAWLIKRISGKYSRMIVGS